MKKMKTAKPDDSIERSAILMMSLGEDAAAEVFRHLSPREFRVRFSPEDVALSCLF